MAMNLLRGGADLILGNHPHVPQIWEVFSPADLYAAAESGETAAPLVLGPDKEQKRAVIYSQGNFVSNQNELERYSGLLLKLIIGVDGATGEPFLKDAGYIPVYTQRFNVNNEYRHTVWPTELAIYELDNGGSKFRPADRQDIRKSWNYVSENQPALKLIRLNETPVWNTLIGAGEAANG
jgi:poly-gamma-glutamate synthesis protein (capsule biosynthesis protein)